MPIQIGRIYQDVTIDELHVKRTAYGFTVSFAFNDGNEKVAVTICGVRDISSICELLDAERVWVEETEDVQTEFGRLTLGISHDYYTEVIFDTLNQE